MNADTVKLSPEFKAAAAAYGMVPAELASRLMEKFARDERSEITITRRVPANGRERK